MYVVILNPGQHYCNFVYYAIVTGLTHLFIGATLMVILIYSLTRYFDPHIMLCSFGFHLFSAEAILSLNYANGWSAPLRLRHRRYAHGFLQICGVTGAIAGTLIVVIDTGMGLNLHGITGVIAVGLAGVSVIIGIIILLKNRKGLFVTCHVSLGITAFLMSTISLCSGLLRKPFKAWAGDITVYILVTLVALYTAIIILMSFLKCMAKI